MQFPKANVVVDSVLQRSRTNRVCTYCRKAFVRLTYTLGPNNSMLHTREAENLIAAQSARLVASAIPVKHQYPGSSLKNC